MTIGKIFGAILVYGSLATGFVAAVIIAVIAIMAIKKLLRGFVTACKWGVAQSRKRQEP
jgi:hypothetical protein